MNFVSAGQKHQGRVRPQNQDNFLIADDLGLYAVADGVESEPCGEKASALAVKTLVDTMRSLDLEQDATPPFEYAEGIPLPARAIKFAFREVNRKIFEAGQADPKLTGMATTLTAFWFHGGKVYIGNVGDSRAYMVRRGKIHQLSRDHTPLAEGDAAQTIRIDFVEDYTSHSGHELTRAMGINADLEIQLSGGSPKAGDIFLLSTDGLYGDIRDFEIQDTITAYPPAQAANELVSLANKRGGKDNVAVVVIKTE